MIDAPGGSQEPPAGPRRPQEAPGGPQEATGGPRRPQEAPGGPRRPQEAPGSPQQAPERPRRPQEAPRRPQEASEGPRRPQKPPKGPGGAQEPPAGPRRPQEAPFRCFFCCAPKRRKRDTYATNWRSFMSPTPREAHFECKKKGPNHAQAPQIRMKTASCIVQLLRKSAKTP